MIHGKWARNETFCSARPATRYAKACDRQCGGQFVLALFVNPLDRAADLLDRAVGDDQFQLGNPVETTLQDFVQQRLAGDRDSDQLRLVDL